MTNLRSARGGWLEVEPWLNDQVCIYQKIKTDLEISTC